jgi:Protein of unknown function (DUF3892)
MAESKSIILVITDSRGVSKAFVTNDFNHLLLEDAIRLVRKGIVIGVHLVQANGHAYLRSDPSSSKEDNLDSLSVPAGSLSRKLKDDDEDERVSTYAKAYGKFLELRFPRNELLYLDGMAQIPRADVIKRLRPLTKEIKTAANKHAVDANLLTAILIDEFARIGPDDLLDILGKIGVRDTTIGLGQVKMSTARDMIKKKYFPADPNISQSKLYSLLTVDEASIQFAAAYLSFITKFRIRKNVGTSAAELASCYSEGLLVQASSRGKQIAEKLRRFAREILE